MAADLGAWQPIENLPKEQTIGVLLFPAAGDEESPDERYEVGIFEPCPTPEICCDGSWDWPWEDRGEDEKPIYWMPLQPSVPQRDSPQQV